MSSTSVLTRRDHIFVNYRRKDNDYAVGRLVKDLRYQFRQEEQIFFDVASIKPGADFEEALRDALATCAAVIVVIGVNWLNMADAKGGRRLSAPDDWVRREIAECLRHADIRVFPVLIDNADMPDQRILPRDIRTITRRQAFPLSPAYWDRDIEVLVAHLRQISSLGDSQRPKESVPEDPAAPEGPRRSRIDEDVQPPPPARERPALPHFARQHARYLIGVAVVGLLVAVLFIGKEAQVEDIDPPVLETILVGTTPPLNVGTVFRDCVRCPSMVVVPSGKFVMGSPGDEPGRDPDEGPQREVVFAEQFAVGKFEVTFDEWDLCVAEGGCQANPNDSGWGRDSRPVVNVNWNEAQAYVRWLSKRTKRDYRLLSEAEWEYAARADSGAPYPWGKEFLPNLANTAKSGSKWSGKQSAPVGSFPGNSWGLYDMIGNVWEWTQDCWNSGYEGAPVDGSARDTGECTWRIVRGGSTTSTSISSRVTFRHGPTPDDRNSDIGFRVASSLNRISRDADPTATSENR